MAQKDTIETLLGHMPMFIRSEDFDQNERNVCAMVLGYATAGVKPTPSQISFMQWIVNEYRERTRERERALAMQRSFEKALREAFNDEKEA